MSSKSYTRRIAVALFVAVIVAMGALEFVVLRYEERQSCLRTDGTRSGLVTFFKAGMHHASERASVDSGVTLNVDEQAIVSDQAAADQERQILCVKVLP